MLIQIKFFLPVFFLPIAIGIPFSSVSQNIQNNPQSNHGNKFEQLGTILPTPNEYRTASGAPGNKYWQQKCDYDIDVTLDEKNLSIAVRADLSIEGIEHTTTKAYHPQTNGICERFHKTMKNEFFETAMRKKIYTSLDILQNDLDDWLLHYNYERPHSGKYCYGKTPMQTFEDSKKLALEKK